MKPRSAFRARATSDRTANDRRSSSTIDVVTTIGPTSYARCAVGITTTNVPAATRYAWSAHRLSRQSAGATLHNAVATVAAKYRSVETSAEAALRMRMGP